MQKSQDNEKPKRNISKTARGKGSKSQPEAPQERAVNKSKIPAFPIESTAVSTGPMLTQEEYRARVARKAFELYEKRRALTEVDDWIEAERLVKLELLDEQQGAIA